MYLNMTTAMHHSMFIATAKCIRTELEGIIVAILRFYGKAVRMAHDELDHNESDDDKVVDICASFDGSWQKRFRGSKIRVGFAIDTLTRHGSPFHTLLRVSACPTQG
jgi:hypothetical protein